MNLSQPQTALTAAFTAAVNEMPLFDRAAAGLLRDGDAISLLMMPGGARAAYYDGSVRQRLCLQILVRHRDRFTAADTAAAIYNRAPSLALDAAGVSVAGILPLSPPQEANTEPDGRVLYSATVAIDFTVKG